MKKDISANLYQKCLILCSNIFLHVLHNTSLTVLLPWQDTGFQTSPISMAFLATFGSPFWYLLMVPYMHDQDRSPIMAPGMIQQAYEYVRSSSWPCLIFFSWKSLKYCSRWGLEKSELPWEENFFMDVGVLLVELLAYQVSLVCAANGPK